MLYNQCNVTTSAVHAIPQICAFQTILYSPDNYWRNLQNRILALATDKRFSYQLHLISIMAQVL